MQAIFNEETNDISVAEVWENEDDFSSLQLSTWHGL